MSIKFNELIKNRKKLKKKFIIFKIKDFLDPSKIEKKTKWKINSSGNKPNYGSNWIKNLNLNELKIVEQICGTNMEKYGYKIKIKNKRYSGNYKII